MRRLLQTELEDVLAVKIITGEFAGGDTAVIDTNADGLTVTICKQVKNIPAAAITLLPDVSPESVSE